MPNNTLYKIISIFLKTVIAVLSVWYIYEKVFSSRQTISNYSFEELFSSSSLIILIFVFILMFLNWSLEAMKWRILISQIEKVSFLDSLKAIFAGVTVSIFSPNRTGEFLGRIFFLKKADRGEATALTFAGNGAQLFFTFFFPVISFVLQGTIGANVKGDYDSESFSSSEMLDWFGVVCTGAFIISLLIAVLFFFFSKRIKNKYIAPLKNIKRKEWKSIFLFSFLRYCVFFLQFFLVLRVCSVYISFLDAMIVIPFTFFSISVIPTLFFTELGIRGAASIQIIGTLSANHEGILAASFILWIINLAIPALLGILPVFRLKFFRRR